MISKQVILTGLLGCLFGCAQNTYEATEATQNTHEVVTNEAFKKIALANNPVARDHAAILAMQGEYEVDFDFKETVMLAPDYERFPPKEAGAFETVLVVQNSPHHIVLQHILVVGDDYVVKHWRQDWTFEATERFEFSANQTWQITAIDPQKREGYWTQCVYEVSDAPRYCGTGRWNHSKNASTWSSDATWRPLPRREYTVRDDYNALHAENRHTITHYGWTHEQDNAKVIRSGSAIEKVIVREFGFNDYRSIKGHDFSPAYNYWQKTASYWAKVRAAWSDNFHEQRQIVINTEVDGMPIIEATFSQAEAIENGEPAPELKSIKNTLSQWVNTPFDQAQISPGN